ncbi:MAG: CPBP family intramembrane metalloprotease [Armatimonadetes bacterium]|nr:CPBP family intramembrane metalloprotease [Armatimonadota bacterium]
MEQSPRSDWKSSLRTIIVALMAVAVLLSLVTGKRLPFGAQRQHLKADMLLRAGDTFMSMYYVALADDWSESQTDVVFTAAGDFYSMAYEADPDNFGALLNTTIMLRLGAQMEESAALVPRLMFRELPEDERKVLGRVAPMILYTFPAESAIEAARDYLSGFGPGPALVANSYREIEQPEKASETLSAAAEQALPKLRTVIAVTILNAVLTLIGLTWFVTAAVLSRRRQKDAETVPLVEGLGVREAIEALIVWVFLVVLLRTYAPWLSSETGEISALVVLAESIAAQVGALAWVCFVTLFRARFGWRRAGLLRTLGTGLAATGAALVPAMGVYALLQDRLGMSPTDDPVILIIAAPQDLATRVIIVAAVGLLVPALEEVLFRGLLFGALRRYLKFWPAAAASALLFAIVHMNLPGLAAYFILGLTFAAVFERTRSLFAAWTAHAAFNLVNLAMVFAIFG